MRRREIQMAVALLSYALVLPGCGGSGGTDSSTNSANEPFVAKGKLKAETDAKATGKKVPQH